MTRPITYCDVCKEIFYQENLFNLYPVLNYDVNDCKDEYLDFDGMVCEQCFNKTMKKDEIVYQTVSLSGKKFERELSITKLMYQWLEEEIVNCFETIDEDVFIDTFYMTPKDAYIDLYKHLHSLSEKELINLIVDNFGIEYINDVFMEDERPIQNIKEQVDNKYKELFDKK